MCYYCVTYEHQSVTTLYSLPECQEAPCSKQVSYLKFKWQQRDSNPKLLRKRTLKPFSQTGQMIELCCEYLSVSCIWLFAIIMSRTIIRVNPHSIVYLNVKEILARSRKSLLWIVFRIYKLKDLNFDVLPEDFARKLEEIRLIPVGRNRENYVFRHTKY